jgi:hypothetical protein
MATTFAVLCMAGNALAQDASAAKPPRRGGAALQFDYGYGGDSLEAVTGNHLRAGEGIGASIGGFYRPRADSPLEIYGFVGYRFGFFAPVTAGYYSNTETWVLQLLGNYRFNNKWYVAGGLIQHLNPRFTDGRPNGVDIDFSGGTGATIEAGYSFIGLYYTYMNYSTANYGDFDASSVGIRFTVRFRKWRPYL